MATSQTSPTRAKRAAARARRAPRTTAAKPRATAARASTRSTSTRRSSRTARAQQLAERVVLIPVGAVLEARNRVAGTVGDLVTTTRTQLERQTRSARRGFDRQRSQALKSLDFDVAGLSGRVENVVQNGAQTGRKLVNGAQDRIAKVI